MNELLSYLIEHLSFLYDEHGARFVDSKVHGPDAVLVFEIADLRLRLVRDRGQFFLDFQSRRKPSDLDWFSFDIVRQFLTKEVVDSAEMDVAKVAFVKTHLLTIADAFSARNRGATEKALHKLEKERAKRLFG